MAEHLDDGTSIRDGSSEPVEAKLTSDAWTDLTVAPSTTLVEVLPGTAVVFGDVPEGLKLVDFGLISTDDRSRLSSALAVLGDTATVAGNVGHAVASAQGLYRVTDTTLALLNNGAQLAAKDGANIGAMFANGKIIGQARFVPYGVTAAQLAAAIGPAIAMIAIQMQLSEVSNLVRANIALTTQTLESLRREQWAELEGLITSVDRAIAEAREIGMVSRLIWEDVAGIGRDLDKQVDLYRRNVEGHVRKLGELQGTPRRQYLESNAEAVLFDSNALLYSLKSHTEYQALRAARARGDADERREDALLADVIMRNARKEFDTSVERAGDLLVALTRELRIVAELPGRATVPLTKKRRDGKTAQLSCGQLLQAIEPLADSVHPARPALDEPEVVCGPDGLNLEPYLHILRWFLDDGEKLRGVAFPYQPSANGPLDAVPPALATRIDASWTALSDSRGLRSWTGRPPALSSRSLIGGSSRRVREHSGNKDSSAGDSRSPISGT